MENFKITEKEISDNNVKNAPDTISADTGSGYTTRDVKNIFDRLPELIAGKFNAFVEWTGNSMLTTEQLQAAVNEALEEAKENGELGGKDGISATHSWEGTTLTITSASGTSSADLEGPPGPRGQKGERGTVWCYFASDEPKSYDFVPISELTSLTAVEPKEGDYVIATSGDVGYILYISENRNENYEFIKEAAIRWEMNLTGPKGDGSDDVGGKDILIVTVTNGRTDYSSADIYAYIKAGGTAILNEGNGYYALSGTNADAAVFVGINGLDLSFDVIVVEGNDAGLYNSAYAMREDVEEALAQSKGSVYFYEELETLYPTGPTGRYILQLDSINTYGRKAQVGDLVLTILGQVFKVREIYDSYLAAEICTKYLTDEDVNFAEVTFIVEYDDNLNLKVLSASMTPAQVEEELASGKTVYGKAVWTDYRPYATMLSCGLGPRFYAVEMGAKEGDTYVYSYINIYGNSGVWVAEDGEPYLASDYWVRENFQPKGDYLTEADLQTATNNALEQAKESGEFDGESVYIRQVIESTNDGGTNTVTFSDGGTLNVKNGKRGSAGQSAVHSWNGTTLTITSASGTSSANLKGDKGEPGSNGTSVTVSNVTTSTADGGSNIVTFSDGKTVTIKNGSKGSTGSAGKDGSNGANGSDGVGIKSVVQTTTSSADGGSNVITVTKTDGTTSTFTVKNGSKGSTGEKGADGKTPARGTDYWTPEDKAEIVAEVQATATQLKPLYAESLEWLAENGDTSKVYVLPDGFIYAYMLTEVEAGPAYTNVLPLAINADGTPYVGTNGEKGYKTGYRLNSSRAEVTATDRCCTGFIAIKNTDTIRFKNISHPSNNNLNGYFHFYASDKTTSTGTASEVEGCWDKEIIPANINALLGTGSNANNQTAYMRISTGIINENSIITINEEIVEGGGTVEGMAWVSTGKAFVPADYEDIITEHTAKLADHDAEIEALKAVVDSGTSLTESEKLTKIRNWDIPIYDKADVFLCSADKESAKNWAMTPTDIYSRYDALMNANPNFITKTDLGLSSDGTNHVYRYDFKEAEPHHQSGFSWSETKPKAIIISGIHYEWGGIYALYNALCEITTNPQLAELRRNVHLIVVPCCNPYATIANNYQSGLATPNSYGVRNANGVEIHRNFEVDHVVIGSSDLHYGGAEPLSEVETQYIDNIMKNNKDAVFFMSCHSCQTDTTWGTNFIWASTATKYMCNMGYRVIDKLSNAWLDKYGDTLLQGIENNKTDALADGDTRLGWAQLSNTAGSEQKQATKYGIQAFNVEITDTMSVLDSTALSAKAMTHGAEVYANFIKTVFSCYDYKDKAEYYK